MEKIVLLHEELDYYLTGWKENSKATEPQKRRWPQNRKLTRPVLGYNSPDCLRLLPEDGLDGEPVGSVAKNTARHYFWDNEDHKWPPDRDIIRLGRFFQLDFFQSLALVLKGQWEQYFAKTVWKDFNEGRNLLDMLRDSIEKARKLSSDFFRDLQEKSVESFPYLGELYRLFDDHYDFGLFMEYDEKKFEALINQMIMSHVHLAGSESPELISFIEKQKTEQEYLREASKQESEAFWVAKCCWLELENEVGNLLLKLEKQRLGNANINHKWMVTFGHVYLPLVETETAYYFLKRRIALKEMHANLSIEELEELEAQTLKEEQDKLEQLKMEIEFAKMYQEPQITYVDSEKYTEYEKECKRALRQIWNLTHPESIMHEKFTDEQKKKLREYFDRSIKIRDREIGHQSRPLNVLLEILDILASVKSLWQSMGLDLNEKMIIQGEGLKEKLDWLEKQMVGLEEQKKDIQAEIYAIINDRDIQEKRASLASDEICAKIIKQMEEKKREYDVQIPAMELQLKSLFADEEK